MTPEGGRSYCRRLPRRKKAQEEKGQKAKKEGMKALLHDVNRLTGGSEIPDGLVNHKIDRCRIVQADAQAVVGVLHLDVCALGRDVKVLNSFEDDVADLLIRVAVNYGKASLLGHLVLQLISRDVQGNDLKRHEYADHQTRGVDDGLDLAGPTLASLGFFG